MLPRVRSGWPIFTGLSIVAAVNAGIVEWVGLVVIALFAGACFAAMRSTFSTPVRTLAWGTLVILRTRLRRGGNSARCRRRATDAVLEGVSGKPDRHHMVVVLDDLKPAGDQRASLSYEFSNGEQVSLDSHQQAQLELHRLDRGARRDRTHREVARRTASGGVLSRGSRSMVVRCFPMENRMMVWAKWFGGASGDEESDSLVDYKLGSMNVGYLCLLFIHPRDGDHGYTQPERAPGGRAVSGRTLQPLGPHRSMTGVDSTSLATSWSVSRYERRTKEERHPFEGTFE